MKHFHSSPSSSSHVICLVFFLFSPFSLQTRRLSMLFFFISMSPNSILYDPTHGNGASWKSEVAKLPSLYSSFLSTKPFSTFFPSLSMLLQENARKTVAVVGESLEFNFWSFSCSSLWGENITEEKSSFSQHQFLVSLLLLPLSSSKA